MSASAVNEEKTLERVASQQDIGNVVGGQQTTLEFDCLECGGVGVNKFPDANPLIAELSSNDSKTFDGGPGERFQDVWSVGYLDGPISGARHFAALYLELLNVWEDDRWWGGGGSTFGDINLDRVEQVRPRTVWTPECVHGVLRACQNSRWNFDDNSSGRRRRVRTLREEA